jgi:DNA repair protein RecN (Recombination protein N)
MERTQFHVRVDETSKLRASGAEKVDFVLLRGTSEIPVAKAASGGELSRLLLAIQVSLPPELIAPTVVFDEVEAGLGGRAAYLTGLKLRELAHHVQVILITHEASIAAMADRHYKVERRGDLSTVGPVDGEERVREIARMLSGRSDDEEALAHARKLLEGAAQAPAEPS